MADVSVSSDAFADGEPIPSRHALDGENLSPPLTWSGLPQGTRSLALVCEDPDAPSGTFVHWVAWGIDPAVGGLGEGEAAPAEGRNGFGHSGYGGPAPPPGHGPHRYFFRLFALDAAPELEASASMQGLEAAVDGHVLATGELMGTYER
jgi:Raf kinase inhibitor-like YbhB/YbcL family protein